MKNAFERSIEMVALSSTRAIRDSIEGKVTSQGVNVSSLSFLPSSTNLYFSYCFLVPSITSATVDAPESFPTQKTGELYEERSASFSMTPASSNLFTSAMSTFNFSSFIFGCLV